MPGISLAEIEQSLIGLTASLEASDIAIASLRTTLLEQTDALEVAKTNAALNAPDAGNEGQRKLNRDKAIADDSVVFFSKKNISDTQFKIAENEAHNASQRRQFAAMCHIAAMRAAQMILHAKGTVKHA